MIMNNNFSKPVRRYIRTARRLLACPRNYRSNFTADMEKDIRQFLLENNSAGYEEITGYFGTPAELARLYLDNVPAEELTAYNARKKIITRFGQGILILLFTISVTCFYFNYIKSRELNVIYIEESLEVEEK
ncbi:MAG: hypothetical protein HFH49_10605 [Lachnospiraceae bacterium]|nr:hypothetical protein [Lachnospiraceae bacterium]